MHTPQSQRPRPWHRAPPGGCPGARHLRSDSARDSLHAAAPGPLLRDGEKLCGTADSPPGRRREDTSSKTLAKPAGRMLSFQAAEARSVAARWGSRGRGGGETEGRDVPPADGRAEGPANTQACRTRALPGAARAWTSCLREFGRQHSGRGAGTKPLKWRV